jgi:hypothetical protein
MISKFREIRFFQDSPPEMYNFMYLFCTTANGGSSNPGIRPTLNSLIQPHPGGRTPRSVPPGLAFSYGDALQFDPCVGLE